MPTVKILNNIDLISLTNGCKFVPYANFISRTTSHLSACPVFPTIFQTGFKEVYRDAKTKEEFEEALVYQWIFLPHCKGIDLSPSVRVDEASVVLYDGHEFWSLGDFRRWRKEMMTDSYQKKPEKIVVEDRSEKRERMVWEHFVQPLVKKYYNDSFKYKFFPDPQKINQGDLEQILRKTRSFCCQGYDCIFKTDIFEEEVMKRLKAGQISFTTTFNGSQFLIPIDIKALFYNFLSDLFKEKTLPIFLEYLFLEYPEGLWPSKNYGKDTTPNSQDVQQDKRDCQDIAKSVWKTHPELAIKYLVKHSEIKKICGPTYSRYKLKTIRKWISEVAPGEVRKQGRISKGNEELQLRMCQKIGIED